MKWLFGKKKCQADEEKEEVGRGGDERAEEVAGGEGEITKRKKRKIKRRVK